MAKLNTYVHVHRKNGESVAFGPNDDLPAWAVDAITNPNVWDEPPAEGERRQRRSDSNPQTGSNPVQRGN